MAPSKTRTVKNKHAAPKAMGVKVSKKGAFADDGKAKRKGPPPSSKAKPSKAKALLHKRKKRVYSEKELDVPKLNMITPAGVEKPKGKKKKVFVDDRESMNTILAMVQADKAGEIESKIMKARQMEEIREARRIEAEKKEAEKRAKLEETKESLRRKRKRTHQSEGDDVRITDVVSAGSKATKPKKKRVSFA